MVSSIGSYMTYLAIAIWAWKITGSATALSLVAFFSLLPRIAIALFAGIIIDRFNRKYLMILSDTVAAILTIVILLLYITGNLQIQHLYLTAVVNGIFGEIGWLAYSTSIAMIVPKQHYTRASSIGFLVHYSSSIFSAALVGSLYPIIGLVGILVIDIITFTVTIASLLSVHIPQPPHQPGNSDTKTIWLTIAFGFRYILTSSGLCALLIATSLVWFALELEAALYQPMILARTGGNATVFGSVTAAAGVGGVIGAVAVSIWGGPQRRMKGIVLGIVGAGVSKTLFGLAQMPLVWITAQFFSSLNFPLLGSSNTALWLTKVAPELQGRVFATRSLIEQVVSAIAVLIAGPLADYVFEPAMMPGGSLAPIFGRVLGTGVGAGMALLYVITSICLLMLGFGVYAFRLLRDVEDIVPDHDAGAG
jgi:MFS transporter, DHA3 family, macrolide efflux protein